VNDWEIKPEGPFNFISGIVDPFGGYHCTDRAFDLTLQQAVLLFAQRLRDPEGRFAGVADAAGQRMIARVRYLSGVIHWGGCKAAFDLLAEIEPTEDVFWWAAEAQNLGMQEPA
jgi:hypothetical protein